MNLRPLDPESSVLPTELPRYAVTPVGFEPTPSPLSEERSDQTELQGPEI